MLTGSRILKKTVVRKGDPVWLALNDITISLSILYSMDILTARAYLTNEKIYVGV